MSTFTMPDGVTWWVSVCGEGTPVLLLHGFAGHGAAFRDWLDPLTDGCRLIAPDLLGHGRSDDPHAVRHAVERQAADLATILGRLDASPACVLGYSFGARVALRLALDHPDSVERMVLVSPSAGITDAEQRAARVASDAAWARMLRSEGLDRFADAWLGQPIFASLAALPDETRRRVAQERAGGDPEGLARSLEGAGQGVMTPMQRELPRLCAPTLVVSGAFDATGTRRATEVASAIPAARHVALPDAGHAPHIEAPTAFADAIAPFLPIPIRTTHP